MEWKGVHPNDQGRPTVLYLDGVGVVRLMDRVDGTWFAQLDYHLPTSDRRRACTSYEAGRQGAEIWAQRHVDRLAREAAYVRSRWVRLACIGDRPEPAPGVAPEPIEVYLARQAEEHRRIAEELVVRPRRARRRR